MTLDFSDWSPLEVQHLSQVLFRFKFDGQIREETGHPALNGLLKELSLYAQENMPSCKERSFLIGMFDQNISEYLLDEILIAKRSHFDHRRPEVETKKNAVYAAIYPLKCNALQDEKIAAHAERQK